MKNNNMALSASSASKVQGLLSKLKLAEDALCKTHDILDTIASKDGEAASNQGYNPKALDISDLTHKLTALKAEKRKLSVKALSTVLTLTEIVRRAVAAGNAQQSTGAAFNAASVPPPVAGTNNLGTFI